MISAWIPVISTLVGGLLAGSVALFVNRQSHHYAQEREKKAAAERLHNEKQVLEEKLARERYFIATELVFMLEQFAENCASIATDQGYENQDGIQVPAATVPKLDYSAVTGDWRTLPNRLMYRIRELPVLKSEADRTIDAVDASPPGFEEFFNLRQYEYIRLGLKAILLARRIRKLAGFPETRLDATPWSAQRVLWNEWRLERKRRSLQAILHARALAAFEIKNDMRRKPLGDALDSGEHA